MESESESLGALPALEKMAIFVGRMAKTMGLWGPLIPLLFLGVAGDPLTIYTLNSSSAVLGSAALLKCRFNIGGPISLTTLQVQWYFSEQRLAQYDWGKGIFAPRMSISEQELLIGNASLGMENVKLSDQGQYKCVVGYGTEQQQSETTLHVLAAPRLSVTRRSAVMDTASSFPCHVWGFYPKDVAVVWLRDGQVLTDATCSDPQRNLDGTFNLTLTYTFTPTAHDSGSNFSCRVSHLALAQPLQVGFDLDVTGASAAVSLAITGVCVALLLVTVAVLAIYCWKHRRAPKGAYKEVGETTPENPAGSRDKMHREDRALMGHDGVSKAGEGHENQPLLLNEVQDQRVTQEPQDGTRITGCSDSAGSNVCESHEAGEAIAAAPGTGAPGPNGDSSANTKASLPGPGMAGDDAGDKASAGLAGKQGGGAAPNFATGGTGEATAETVPDTAQKGDASGETGGNVPQPPVLCEISQPQVLAPGEQVTLSCEISRFYPKELTVTWHRRGRGEPGFMPLDNSDTHNIVTPDPTAAPDRKSYSVKSELCFTPLVSEDDGAEYLCYVEHETLQDPKAKVTGQLELRGCSDSAISNVCESHETGEAVAAAPGTGAPGPNGDSSANTKAGLPGPGMAGDDTGDKASAGLAGKQGGGAAPNFAARGTGEAAAETVPDTAQKGDASGETGGNVPQPPVLCEISRPQVLAAGEQVTLSCQILGFYPKELRVTWSRRGREELEFRPLDNSDTHKIVTPDPTAEPYRKSYSVKSELCFIPLVPKDDGVEFQCDVEHETLQDPETKVTGQLELRARPQVSEIQVLPHWEPQDQVPFVVQIRNFYPKEIHRIQWCCDGMAWEKSEPTVCSQNPDLTFNTTSVWRILSQKLNSLDLRVQVSIQQTSRDNPVKTEIRARDTGLLRPPMVSEICKPESVSAGEETTLSCRVTGHFPGALSVSWLRRERGAVAAVTLKDSSEYRIDPGAPHTQDGKSFQQETRLSFTHSARRDQGAEYVCRVGHIALQTPMQRRSGQLQVTGHSDSAATKTPESEKRRREEEPTESRGAAAVTDPLVMGGPGDTTPKGKAGGDGGAETKSASDTLPKELEGDNAANEGTATDMLAKEWTGDNTANEGATSDTLAEDRVGDNAANEDTTSDTSAKEQTGDNAANEGATSDVSAKDQEEGNAANEGATSDAPAKDWERDNAANEGATTDASAEEWTGDNAANESATSDTPAEDQEESNTASEAATSNALAKEQTGDSAVMRTNNK